MIGSMLVPSKGTLPIEEEKIGVDKYASCSGDWRFGNVWDLSNLDGFSDVYVSGIDIQSNTAFYISYNPTLTLLSNQPIIIHYR